MEPENDILKPTFNKEEVTGFLKNNLPHILKTYFTEPVTGTYNLFKNADSKVYQNSIVLISVTALLYIIVPYLLAGSMRELVGFFAFVKIGLGFALFQVMISTVSFAVKSISGKPNFKRELLTGALCGIPLVLLLVIMILAKIFVGSIDITDMLNPFSVLDNLKLLLIPMLFVWLLLINTLLQSFRASGVKETLSWYAAPLALGLAVYLTYLIIEKIFF